MAKRLRIYLPFTFAVCLAGAGLLFSACNQNEHIHDYGAWSETPASCETAGQRTRSCIECGAVQTEPIEKLGHDWQEVEIIVQPTCEEPGLRSAVCSRCHETADEQVVPALDHDWEIKTIQSESCLHGGEYSYTCKRDDCNAAKTVTTEPVDHVWDSGKTVAAKCESEGSVTYTCIYNCGTEKVEKIKALEHAWGAWQTVDAATCTEKGLDKQTCTREGCGKTQTRTTSELGHSFSNGYTVDLEPTYETEGSQSKHCTRSGCKETQDSQTIPRLEVTYTVYIKDSCGSYYYGNATIEFYVKGQLVESAAMADSRVNTLSLNSPECNVKVTGLNKGYFANAEGYDLTAEQPQVTVCLGAAVMDGPKEQLPFYKTGSVLYDQEYIYYGENDELQTTTLKTILSSKKGIIMNYYYNGCPPCNSEMSALIAASKEYQEDVAVIMVNYYDTEKDLLAFRDRNDAANTPLMFLNGDSSKYTFKDFASVVKYFPTSAFIDCNGQVVTMNVGGLSQAAFGSYIKTYILNRYNTLHPTQTTKNTRVTYTAEAILPSKKFGF